MDDRHFFDEEAIRRRVERRWRRRMKFAFHLVFYVVSMAFLWIMVTGGVPWINGQVGKAWLITFIWTPLLIIHGLYVSFHEAQERAVQREIERERAWFYQQRQEGEEIGYERLMLSEDGEVLEVVDDGKPKRGVDTG